MTDKVDTWIWIWDNDAEPDEKGNQWRMAKNPMTIKATTTIEG